MRVEPAIVSLPVCASNACLAARKSSVLALLAIAMVSAPAAPADFIAATVKGVLPLAATPMTTSLGPKLWAEILQLLQHYGPARRFLPP